MTAIRYQTVGGGALHMAASEGEWSHYGLGLALLVMATHDDAPIAWCRQVAPGSNLIGPNTVRPLDR